MSSFRIGVKDAADATQIAIQFLMKYSLYNKPKGATLANGKWTVKVDVGLTIVRLATVEIDATNREILSYNIP